MKLAILASALLASAANAEQVCQNVYNPLSNRWEYQCVERPARDPAPPRCRQEYDAMNNVWVTVCE
jgi:hypothetical protein